MTPSIRLLRGQVSCFHEDSLGGFDISADIVIDSNRILKI